MIFKSFNNKAVFTSLFALSAFLPMSACDLANNYTKIDRSTNSEFQDYRDALAQREVPGDDASSNAIPDVESYVTDGSDTMKSAPLVSLSINQSIPLREALFELAKQADYDIELDPRISGSIIFTARNKPFDEVIDRICEISGLRYKVVDDSIRIEIDSPYSKNYKIDYLSFVRKNDSNIQTDVSVASTGGTGVGGGSKYSMTSSSESDFWTELDANLKQLLTSNASPSYLKTKSDPVISLTATNPVNPPAPPIDGAALQDTAPQAGTEDYISTPQMVTQDATATPAADVTAPTAATTAPVAAPTAAAPSNAALPSADVAAPTTAAPTTAAPAAAAAPQAVTSQPAPAAQSPVLKVESLPTAMAGGQSAGGENSVQFTPAFSINKQAGIISVYANERLHKQVGSYLEALRRATTAQVLIEAKVLEVTLSDEFATGIDWNLVDSLGDFEISGSFPRPAFDPAALGNTFSFGFAGNDITSFVSALSRFGTVHALASPRLTVLNNQSAVLSVARNQVYFELDVTASRTGTGVDTALDTTVNSEIKTVPEGVLINVLPSIDLASRSISMQVRPTVTKIDDYVDDPGVTFIAAQNNIDITSRIPVMNVQEVDSVLNMKDKQMMVMGGLLQDSTTNEQSGVPIASEVPVLGALFRNQGDKVYKKELVIFIKATILDNASDSIHQTDKDLYRVFGQDRRPSKL